MKTENNNSKVVNKTSKIQVEKIIEEKVEAPFQYLKEKPVEHIPNAHLAVHQIEEGEQNMTINEEELNVVPIFIATDTETENETNSELPQESIFTLMENQKNTELDFQENKENTIEGVKSETQSVESTHVNPLEKVLEFINENYKPHLIETNFLSELVKKIYELKETQNELLENLFSAGFEAGYKSYEENNSKQIEISTEIVQGDETN